MIYRQGRWELSIYSLVTLRLREGDRVIAQSDALTKADLEDLEAMMVEHNDHMRRKVQSGRCGYCGHHGHPSSPCPADQCSCCEPA